MSRYIDADVAINLAKEEIDSGTPNDIAWKLEALPTVDVVERKRGEWNFEESPDGYYHAECSECGHWFYEDAFLKPYNYCPNCGAEMLSGVDMRGEKDE